MIASTEEREHYYENKIGVLATVSFIGALLCSVGSLYFFLNQRKCVIL